VAGEGKIEVAGVADHHDVEVARGAPKEAELRRHEASERGRACAPAVGLPLPDADVPLDYVDPGTPQARDHLRVARIVAVIGAEVENPHQPPIATGSL
jgi:hypothetical protein